jgi:glycosyltransferase involved in cell wall biosynthesis
LARDVVIYCPDRHIVYDGDTPYLRGVGGGITARVRMANALARAGHRVTAVVNCPEPRDLRGVHYRPLDDVDRLAGDVVILTTSGDRLDLSPALRLRVEANLKIAWVHGPIAPTGLHAVAPDVVYAVSNYIAGIVRREWGVASDRVFVTYNGYDDAAFRRAEAQAGPRDPYSLMYSSHPSKGLDTALGVLRLLREKDARFHLKVFGSEALWGETPLAHAEEEGVTWEGLVGQEELTARLLESGFSLQMQDRQEPGALAIVDALRAGCVLVGSPVGCYPEMVRDGENGILISGDHAEEATRCRAAECILELARDRGRWHRLGAVAQRAPWSTDRMADVWSAHWEWWLRGRREDAVQRGTCLVCGEPTLTLPDGEHCLTCASYEAAAPQPA